VLPHTGLGEDLLRRSWDRADVGVRVAVDDLDGVAVIARASATGEGKEHDQRRE
jgi:hypothetical protein